MSGSEARDAVRRSYDTVADRYAEGFRDEIAHKPLDRALLTALLEQTETGAPVADLGCGPGHIAAWLAARGATTVGVDLSPAMVDLARRDHPGTDFRQGDLLDLPARDGEFGAVLALYSVIHLTGAELPRAFAEMHRVLRPGGSLLVSFHIGTEVRHLTEWLGHEVDVDFHFFEPAEVESAIEGAGFAMHARLERSSYAEEVQTRRAYLMAQRP